MTSSTPDILFEIKNSYYIGNYQTCVNEAQKLKHVRVSQLNDPALQLERDWFMYRAYICQRKLGVVISDISSSSPLELQMLKFLAEFMNALKSGDGEAKETIVRQCEQKLQTINPDDKMSPFIVAQVHYSAENYEAAIKLIHDSDHLESLLLLAQIHLSMNRIDLAMKTLNTMKQIDEDCTVTQLCIAWVNLKKNGDNLQEAFHIFDELGQKYASTPMLLNGQAAAYIAMGKYADAEPLLQDAMDKDPNNSDALVNMCVLYHFMGKPSEVMMRYINQLKDLDKGSQFVKDYKTKIMKVLIYYCNSSKVLILKKPDDLRNLIPETFKVKKYSLKRFDNEFDEYVDVDDLNVIQDKDKLIVYSDQAGAISPFSRSTSLSFNQDLSFYQGIGDSSFSSGGGAIFQGTASQGNPPLRCEKWPSVIEIREKDFSRPLRDALKFSQPLTYKMGTEITDHLTNLAFKYKSHPILKERNEICLALIRKYPYLHDGDGFGIATWETRLMNKLKKFRKRKNSMEFKTVRSCRSIGGLSQFNAAVVHKPGLLNWAPDHIQGENETTVVNHKRTMIAEKKKTTYNKENIENLMNLTFSYRREMINRNVPLSQLKKEYPFLFEADFQMKEFKRLTAIDVSVFYDSVLEKCPKIAKFVEGKRSSFSICVRGKEKWRMAELGLKMLPTLLKEDVDSFFIQAEKGERMRVRFESHRRKIETTTCQGASTRKGTLKDQGHLLIKERGSSNNLFDIIFKKEILSTTNNFLTAVCLMFSFYYSLNIKFPPFLANTFAYIQVEFFGIVESRIPKKVMVLKKKIASIA